MSTHFNPEKLQDARSREEFFKEITKDAVIPVSASGAEVPEEDEPLPFEER